MLLLVLIAAGAAAAWWLQAPLPQRAGAAVGGAPLELEIEPGTTPRGVARAAVQAGLDVRPDLLYWWFRLSGKDRDIRAGNYEIPRGTSPQALLQKLVRGEEALRAVTLVEGWNWRQVRQALARAEQLRPDSAALSDAELMAALERPGVPPEGRFFPDTYT